MPKTVKWCLSGIVVIALGVLLYCLWPLPERFTVVADERTTSIVDYQGVLLYEVRNEQFGTHEFIGIDQVPDHVLELLVATEDRRFYTHHGVSVPSIVRAAWQNLSAGQVVSGGSTITQQVVRNVLRPPKRTFLYKCKEALLALRLDAQLTKGQILELYINKVYFGHQAYGIAAAAKVYFNKAVHELSVAEAAMLVGIVQSPSVYDPFINFAAAQKRQSAVLNAAVQVGILTKQQAEDLQSEPVQLVEDTVGIKAPHFVMWLMQKHSEYVGQNQTVHTTIDAALQSDIEKIITYQLKWLQVKNVSSAAVVVLDVRTGAIKTMVGSADFFNSATAGQVNSATALRQPGSTLKPFTYALALMQGDTAATTVADTNVYLRTQDGNAYTPRNYDFEHHGLVRYREALANSYNIPAIKVLQKVGVPALMNLLAKSGITSLQKDPEHYGLALTLGSGEVSLLELTQAYGMLANQGRFLPVHALQEHTTTTSSQKQVLPKQIAWLISNILSDNSARTAEFGLDNVLEFDFAVAAKTGTTRNARDNWLVGYTPNVVVGVWVGNANNEPMVDTSGITGAGPIFHDVMQRVMQDYPKQDFVMPPGVVQTKICRLSGMLPTELCTNTMQEYFIAGTEPNVPDTMHTLARIDTRTGLLASSDCPEQFVTKKPFVVYPFELQDWAKQNSIQQPPTDYSPLCSPKVESATSSEPMQVQILQPVTGSEFLLDPTVPDVSERITLRAQTTDANAVVEWYINNELFTTLPASQAASWQPQVGTFTIRAQVGEQSDTVFISVEE